MIRGSGRRIHREQDRLAVRKHCGLSTNSSGFTETSSSGFPPLAETRRICESWVKTIPSGPQLSPRGLVVTGQIVTAAPPRTSIRLSVRSEAQKAIDWLSGEKTGMVDLLGRFHTLYRDRGEIRERSEKQLAA